MAQWYCKIAVKVSSSHHVEVIHETQHSPSMSISLAGAGVAKKISVLQFTALAAFGLAASQANALCTFGGSGEPSLQGSCNSMLGENTLSREIFSPQDYILAWEDLAGGGDRDYQDFVAVVQDIAPVPLPTPVLLLISGLVGLAGVSRPRFF